MSQVKWTVRQAVANDAASYNAFIRKIADEPNNGVLFHAGEFTATVDDTRKRLSNAEPNVIRTVFVAVDEHNRVIGETSAGARDRLATRHSVGLGISVDAEYRGQGIGKALMQALINWATTHPSVHRIELEVFTDNFRAINLYVQLGFVVEGTKRNAYRKHGTFKDSYIMALLLEDK